MTKPLAPVVLGRIVGRAMAAVIRRVSTPIEPGYRLSILPQRDRIGVEPSWFGCMQQPGEQPGMQGKRANADHALAPCSREIQLHKHRTLEYSGYSARYVLVRRKRATFVKGISLRAFAIGFNW
jgi:hypothetical protein